MCAVTVEYRDGSIVVWLFDRKTRLADAMRRIREHGRIRKASL